MIIIFSLPLFLIAIPIVIVTWLLKPFVVIRFGPIRNDVFGHFVFDPEYYLSWKEISESKTYDFFYYQGKEMPNEHWPMMVNRSMHVYSLVAYLDKVNRLIPGWQRHFAALNEYSCRDIRGFLRKTKPHINFTDHEIESGNSFLKEVGIKQNDQIVCVISRDPVYKETFIKKGNRDWSYHSYRDSDIANYQKTINTLTNHGFFVFRMGKGVKCRIDDSHHNVFDYANSKYRSDFLDIFLSANCKFFIIGESGLMAVPEAFRVPIVFVNLSCIEYAITWNSNIISIPKKYWLKEEKRFMKFKEIFASGAGRFLQTALYEKLGIELIENTPDEILDVSMEMQHRLDGTWETTEEEEVLQMCFWDMFPKSELHGDEIHARIGSSFLRQNQDLLN